MTNSQALSSAAGTSLPDSTPNEAKFRLFSRIAAIAVLVLAMVILVAGWLLDVHALRMLMLRSANVSPNTVLGLAGAAASLWLLQEGASRPRRAVGRVVAALPIIIGLLTLTEYVTGRDIGVDGLLAMRLNAVEIHRVSLRPHLVTAFSLPLLGFALYTLDSPPRRDWRLADECLGIAGFLAISASLGYIIEGWAAAPGDVYVTMALPTTFTILVLVAALFTVRPRYGIMADILRLHTRHGARERLWVVGFVAAQMLLGYSTWLAWQHSARLQDTLRWVVLTHEVDTELAKLLSSVQGIQDAVLGYVITGDAAYLPSFDTRVTHSIEERRRLLEVMQDDQARAALPALTALIDQRIAIARGILDLRRQSGFEAARDAVAERSGKTMTEEIRVQIANLRAREATLLAQRRGAALREAVIVPVLIVTSASTSAAVLSIVLLLVVRESRLRERAEESSKMSARRLDRALESARMGAWELDRSYEASWRSHGHDAIFGHQSPLPTWNRTQFLQHVVPEDRERAEKSLKEAFHTGHLMLECQIVASNRERRWIFVEGRLNGDEPVRLLGTVVDITERRLAEERDRFQALLLDTVGQAVISTDPQGRITYLNRAAESLYGWAGAEAVGRDILEVMAPQVSRIQATEMLLAGEEWSGVFIAKNRSGSLFPVEIHETPIIDRDGKVIGIIGVTADITARQQAMAELSRQARELAIANQLLQVANAELESFSYSVSHDLRAPLRNILGYLQLLTRDAANQFPEKARRHLQTIGDAAVQMGRLIDGLLEFSRVGKIELLEQRIELDELVYETIRSLDIPTSRKIYWKIAPLPDVVGDPSAIKQVFANLIGNAVKFSRGSNPAIIEIGRSGEQDGRVILFVRDNGVGFGKQSVDKLFGVFQRLHPSGEFEGTGIGLAIVQRIIARHGGRAWAEATPGKGATFYFSLRQAMELHPLARG